MPPVRTPNANGEPGTVVSEPSAAMMNTVASCDRSCVTIRYCPSGVAAIEDPLPGSPASANGDPAINVRAPVAVSMENPLTVLSVMFDA